VALASGLRSNELRSLRVRHLDCVNNGFKLEAGFTKNRKACFQPIHSALVRALAQNVSGKQPEDLLLYVPKDTAKALYRDLKKAGIPKLTADGKLDFHALRVAYVTLVFETGASVKEAQTSARHSSPDLTANVYARTRSARLSEIAQAVGDAFLKCTTEVQQPTAPEGSVGVTADSANVCANAPGAETVGSNPAAPPVGGMAEAGQRMAESGLIRIEVVQHLRLAAKFAVNSRTAPAARAVEAGRLKCPTVVQQRDLALLLAKTALLRFDDKRGSSAA
jgi:hypothetical protein